MDATVITQDLIKIPSITPCGEDALDYIEKILGGLGFKSHRLIFSESGQESVDNVYAEYGDSGPNLCFAGHVDVVPPGDTSQWTLDPFAGLIQDNVLFGRGAVDMKGSIGAYLYAVHQTLTETKYPHRLSLMITCDEEGVAINGTAKIIEWIKQTNRHIDLCIVGEPTCIKQLGDTMKIGRRGSLTGYLTVTGHQGHVAYPQWADNPIPRLITTLDQLIKQFCRDSHTHFDASNIEVTTIDVENSASNIIPQEAQATFNIRFNPTYTVEGLKQWIISICDNYAGKHSIQFSSGSNAFIQKDDQFTAPLQKIIHNITGLNCNSNTAGGTSDARFIHHICPVIEFGLVGQTMHQINENVSVKDLTQLSKIYQEIIEWWSKR